LDDFDGSADVASDGDSSFSDTEAADETLDSTLESDVGDDFGADSDEPADAAPADKPKAAKTDKVDTDKREPAKPKAEAKPKSKADQHAEQQLEQYEKVSGFRLHKEDADRFKKLVKGAYGAFEKANELEQLFKPENRDKLFERMKLDPDGFAAERLAKRLEERLQTPEEKAKSELERERDELLERVKKYEKDQADKELADLEQHEAARIDREWTDVLKAKGLPGRREVLRRTAEIAKDYLAKGIDAPIEHIAEIVKEERETLGRETLKRDFEDSDDAAFDAVMKGLGDKSLKRMRAWFIAQVRRPQGATPPNNTEPPVPRKRRETKPISPDEFHERMGL
jgi:hypothetical protein